MLLPLVAAFVVDLRRDRSRALKGVGLAAVISLTAFVVATPSALVNPAGFIDGIDRLTLYPEGNVKVGQTEENGWRYYLWVLTWGLGWDALGFGIVGGIHLALRRRVLAWALVPAPVLYLLFMGNQDRFFGRWLLPIFPFLILLAAYGAFIAVDTLATRWPRWRLVATVVAVGALLIPSLLHSVHADLVRGQDRSRQLTRQWMLENVPPGDQVVGEAFGPKAVAGGKSWNWSLQPARSGPGLDGGGRPIGWYCWSTSTPRSSTCSGGGDTAGW